MNDKELEEIHKFLAWADMKVCIHGGSSSIVPLKFHTKETENIIKKRTIIQGKKRKRTVVRKVPQNILFIKGDARLYFLNEKIADAWTSIFSMLYLKSYSSWDNKLELDVYYGTLTIIPGVTGEIPLDINLDHLLGENLSGISVNLTEEECDIDTSRGSRMHFRGKSRINFDFNGVIFKLFNINRSFDYMILTSPILDYMILTSPIPRIKIDLKIPQIPDDGSFIYPYPVKGCNIKRAKEEL